jgi:hypothetical protein
MKKKFIPFFLYAAFMTFLVSACDDTTTGPEDDSGKIALSFEHKIDGEDIDYDTMKYVNAAGNPYLVNEIQYFISDVRLWKDGKSVLLDQWEDIHYVDTDLPDTWIYSPADDLAPGNYDSVNFIFGITEEKNHSFMFVNPPESYMFWPEYLGGGYHYLKLNGKWKAKDGVIKPFNFHMGIGQIYNEQGEIIGFVQNYFQVSLPGSSFEIKPGETTRVIITMNVEEWFKDPNIFDFDYWGGDIMEKQPAMQAAKENGHNVFSFRKE